MQYRPHRYPTQFPIRLKTPDGFKDATLLDVNETGARVQGQAHLRRGDIVTVLALNEHVPGTVRWVGNDRVGISFSPAISRRVVDILRRAEKGSQARRFNTLGLSEMM